MKITVVPILILLTLSTTNTGGCRKKDKKDALQLIGKWEWVKTFCCGRRAKWTYPTTCECTKLLELRKDGTYSLIESGYSIDKENRLNKIEGKFQLRKGLNDYSYAEGDTINAIVFDEEAAAYLTFRHDTLIIDRGYMDLDIQFFVRKK